MVVVAAADVAVVPIASESASDALSQAFHNRAASVRLRAMPTVPDQSSEDLVVADVP